MKKTVRGVLNLLKTAEIWRNLGVFPIKRGFSCNKMVLLGV